MKNMNNCCSVFVTYHPSEDFVKKVKAINEQMNRVIIVDNTPGWMWPRVLTECKAHCIHIVRNEINMGIACALNQGVMIARDLGHHWILTFDQDSNVAENYISQMVQVHERISAGSYRPLALLGPNYIDQVLQCPAHAADCAADAIEVRDVITSGSLLSIEAYTAVGGFDEKLFIDMVDTDFCFRVRQAGYSVWRTTEPLMQHSLGRLTPRKVFGFRFNVTNHLPQRRYYIFRNSIDMVKKYFSFDFGWCLFIIFSYLPKVFIKACIFEERKKENLRYIMLGVLDGIFSRFSRKVL